MSLFHGSPALAATNVHLPNGATVTRGVDGTLYGTATLGDWTDELGEEYPITMPDGTVIEGRCLDFMHFAPAPGTYSFVATPKGNGSYTVTLNSSGGAISVRQPVTNSPLQSPPQRIGDAVWSPVLMGSIRLEKSSTMPGITNNNACYTLAGARYSLWEDEACTRALGSEYDLVTTQNGTSNEVSVAPGTYWVKEEQPPAGFIADPSPHRATVGSGQAITISVSDAPLYEKPQVWACKQDAEYGSAQGAASLAGAEFTIHYYDGIYESTNLPAQATRTWVVRSNSAGDVFPTNKNLVGGSALYTDGDGASILPLGTVTIQETKAPVGYWLEGQTKDSPASYEAPIHLAHVTGSQGFGAPTILNLPKRAGISLQKTDAQTGTQAQGDATLAGISFAIVNRNNQAVVVDGVVYGPGETIGQPLVTDNQGKASTRGDYLPIGTYEIQEIATNESMLMDAAPQTITLTESHTNVVVQTNGPFANRVVRGGVQVGKVSRETGLHVTQGEASLKGAMFEVELLSDQPVLVNGTMYDKGEVVCTLVTDETGIARTTDNVLPYGTYRICEVTPPTGFLNNDDWSRVFSIRENGQMADVSSEDDSVDDQVMRGGFWFNKADGASMERMPLVAWEVTSATTGESHVLVSDENGLLDTEACAHSHNTNTNDQAFMDGILDETKIDPEAGVWFSGRTDLTTTPNDDLCALPYDIYRIREIPSSANEGHELVEFTVRIHKHEAHIDMGTINDTPIQQPRLGTSLSYGDGVHLAPAGSSVTLCDVVSYEGLVPGKQYTIEGDLMDTQNKRSVAHVSTSFEPSLSSGDEVITFEFDASEMEGHTLVAFEKLMCDGQEVALHEDWEDEGQTVHFPVLGTSLADEEGNAEVCQASRITLVDTVRYSNVIPLKRYEVAGVLMDKETGQALCDANGTPISATTSFVAESSEGTVQVTFVFEGEIALGKTLVAFETLRHVGIDIATHANINDADQTVHICGIHTELSDERGHHVIESDGKVLLVDTVSYHGLEVGESYELTGTLFDTRTNDVLPGVSATTTFVPTEPTGSAQVCFEIDTADIAGSRLVAFETLSHNGRIVSVHNNPEDQAQSVYLPRIGTTLTEAGSHEVMAQRTRLTDEVAYEGLRPNVPYTLVGTLVDKQSGEPIQIDGSVVSSAVEFTPQEMNGTVSVTFDIDASELAGHSVVAFEYLHEGATQDGRTVAEHADLQDAGQTVTFPKIRTIAHVSDGSKSMVREGTVTICDSVSYEGLTPGTSYVMTGTLHDANTGKALTDSNGESVKASKPFVAKDSRGTVEVEISFDASRAHGDGVVVFESCRQDGKEVATHADLNNKDQTISIVSSNKDTSKESTTSSRTGTPSTGDTSTMAVAALLALLGFVVLAIRLFV